MSPPGAAARSGRGGPSWARHSSRAGCRRAGTPRLLTAVVPPIEYRLLRRRGRPWHTVAPVTTHDHLTPSRPELLEPAHGVSLAMYALVARRMASRGYDPSASDEIAEDLGISPPTWQLARKEWDRRLSGDPAVAAEFSHHYKHPLR